MQFLKYIDESLEELIELHLIELPKREDIKGLTWCESLQKIESILTTLQAIEEAVENAKLILDETIEGDNMENEISIRTSDSSSYNFSTDNFSDLLLDSLNALHTCLGHLNKHKERMQTSDLHSIYKRQVSSQLSKTVFFNSGSLFFDFIVPVVLGVAALFVIF